ncbi:MAG: hypothetical protein KBD21_02045 [Candidatus Pacebacteria bacterium]|nr:hypothetical protein [Candidatus Paceibacterota bacterium]
MPYLSAILEAEERARVIREQAEREAVQIVADKRAELAARDVSLRTTLDAERAHARAAQAKILEREYEAALAKTKIEADRVITAVRPHQEQAIARVRAHILE